MRNVGNIIDNLKKGGEAPSRHHNPYLKEALLLNDYLYTHSELVQNKDSIFQNENKMLVVEIGCYMGKNIIEFSNQNQNINFVGLDITYKRAVKAAKKLNQVKQMNAKIALCDGMRFLSEIMTPNSLTGVCVFFPDPWPKDRHEKNRLLNADFFKLLEEKLSPQGFFWFKTDALNYFKECEKLLIKTNLTLVPQCVQPTLLQGGPYETAFEKIFTSKQVPFYQCVYLKK